MTFRLLFEGRHFRSISLEKYMAVFCVDFAAYCTIGTTNMSIKYMFMKTMSLYLAVFVYYFDIVHYSYIEQVAAQNQQINPCAYGRQRKMDRKWRPRFQLARLYIYTALCPRSLLTG